MQNKTATDKLLKKEFKLSNTVELWQHIDKKQELFFEHHFFLSKAEYKTKLKAMIDQINEDADTIGQAMQGMRSGSMFQGLSSAAYGEILPVYKSMRKALINHVRIFLT